MSDNLRAKLIRLAHQKPELRKDLLPLLASRKQAGGFSFSPKVTPQMVADTLALYWSPRQQAYNPSMMGHSMAKGPEGLEYVLGLDLQYDVSQQFQKYAEKKADELESLVLSKIGHANAKNIAKTFHQTIWLQGMADTSWGDLRYSTRLQSLISFAKQIQDGLGKDFPESAGAVADWLEDYVAGVQKARATVNKLIPSTVKAYLKKKGLDKSLEGNQD